MKPITFLILTTLLAVQADAQVDFLDNWGQAKERAQQNGKYIFLDAYTDWCGWCKVMDKKTFSDEGVTEAMHRDFVPVKLEMEKEATGRALAMKYNISSFPSFLIFSSEGKLLYRVSGYQPPEDFLETLAASRESDNQMEMPGMSVSLDIDYPDFYRKAFQQKKVWPDEATVATYLESQEDLFSEVNWAVVRKFQNSEMANTFFLDHFDQYEELYGSFEVQAKLNALLQNRINTAVEEKDETEMQELLGIIDHFMEDDQEMLKLYYQVHYYKQVNDWKNYLALMEQFIEQDEYESTGYINSQGWHIYENVDEPVAVNAAIEWMKNVVVLEPTYAYLDTYAALLFKAKKYDMALQFAQRAIEVGKSEDENTSETEQLIEEIEAARRE